MNVPFGSNDSLELDPKVVNATWGIEPGVDKVFPFYSLKKKKKSAQCICFLMSFTIKLIGRD